jgi:hypothetical protein
MGLTSKKHLKSKQKEATKKQYVIHPHQNVNFSYCGVEVCNAIAQSPIQGIKSDVCTIASIMNNHMTIEQIMFYSDGEDEINKEGVTINGLPLMIQDTVPSFCLRILKPDGDVVQDDNTYFIRLPNVLLGQGHTYETLIEEARNGIRHIAEGLANKTIRSFVVVVAVGGGQKHMFAVVNKLGVWFILDSACPMHLVTVK